MSKDSNRKPYTITWTPEEDNILRDHYLDKTNVELAKLIPGHSFYGVKKRLQVLELKKPADLQYHRAGMAAREKWNRVKEQRANDFFLKGYNVLSIIYLSNQIRQQIRKLKLKKVKVTMPMILNDISKVYGISIDRIMDKSSYKKENRDHEIVFCRQLFCYLAKKLIPGIKLGKIAHFIGYPEHTMVSYNVKIIKESLDVSDPRFLKDYTLYISKSAIFNNNTDIQLPSHET